MALNPVAYTEHVVRSFLRYQLTAYPFADPRLHAQMRDLLSLDETRRSPLLKGPYVSLSRPFRRGAAVADLIGEGLLHPHLGERIPETVTHLYGHQERAVRAIAAGRTTLVATGTGSGKTECFLYPIVSRCLGLRDEAAAPGVSAVIVYPMNALAEDQLMRLRGLLAGTGIPFGMYVGKTPEHEAEVAGVRLPAGSSRADYQARLDQARRDGSGETVCPAEEVCSREVMRTPGRQPRILLTNVKQLELLLPRQQDVELFAGARLDFLVFDEAHTFTGALGAETACLIRRLRAFCWTDPAHATCIATSATIVDHDDPRAGRNFAARFFGVAADSVTTVGEDYETEVWAASRFVPPAPAEDTAELLDRAVRAVEDETPAGPGVRAVYRALAGEELGAGAWPAALHAALSRNEIVFRLLDGGRPRDSTGLPADPPRSGRHQAAPRRRREARADHPVAERGRPDHPAADRPQVERARRRRRAVPGEPVRLPGGPRAAGPGPTQGVPGAPAAERQRRLPGARRPSAARAQPRRVAVPELPAHDHPRDAARPLLGLALRRHARLGARRRRQLRPAASRRRLLAAAPRGAHRDGAGRRARATGEPLQGRLPRGELPGVHPDAGARDRHRPPRLRADAQRAAAARQLPAARRSRRAAPSHGRGPDLLPAGVARPRLLRRTPQAAGRPHRSPRLQPAQRRDGRQARARDGHRHAARLWARRRPAGRGTGRDTGRAAPFSVLAAEGFLPGYGLEVGSVVGWAEIPFWRSGAMDFSLPRPPATALREYVPGNLIYANGHRFVARRFHRDLHGAAGSGSGASGGDRAEMPFYEVSAERQAVRQTTRGEASSLTGTVLQTMAVCDADLVHTSHISDEEDLRFQLGVAIYGTELGQHSGGRALRWGPQRVQLRRGVRLRLVNVGAGSLRQSSQPTSARGLPAPGSGAGGRSAPESRRGALGYPVCTVCGQSVSPLSSERQRENFRAAHAERCGRPPDGIGFHADVTADVLSLPACDGPDTAYSVLEALRIGAARVLDMHVDDLQILVIGHVDRAEVGDGLRGEQIRLDRTLGTTTPDVVYHAEDHDADEGVCIYLDGLSEHLHGNPETAARDRDIRTWLRNHGREVLEISVHDLDDENAMVRHFRRLAGYRSLPDLRRRVRADRAWFRGATRDAAATPRPRLRRVAPAAAER